MIVKSGSGFKVKSEKGKNLGGPYKTKAAAAKRLRQVEYFKHNHSHPYSYDPSSPGKCMICGKKQKEHTIG